MPASTVLEPLRYTRDQARYLLSEARFNVVPAGRRGGKTAIAKRRLRKKAMRFRGSFGTRLIAGAPTHAQAKRIYWRDFKLMFPKEWRLDISESDLSITLLNGAIVQVMGMDEPARAEGAPCIHFLLDEYGNMKPGVWTENLRPMLTDTQGTADIIGAPEGRNHYYEMWLDALGDRTGEWATHTWWTESVLPMYLGEAAAIREIKSARNSMDKLTYAQEYRAEFIAFSGLAYYNWARELHTKERVHYNPHYPLMLCFDFNRSPGVAVIAQELMYRGRLTQVSESITAVIGEVFIERNSTTPSVCRKIIQDWSHHKGEVLLYGDSTGGAKSTSSTEGSDWDLIDAHLRPVFGERLSNMVTTNPLERVRVNAMNSRLLTADGQVHMLVDPVKCPRLIRDFEATVVKEGGAGEIDKEKDSKRWSHITDALGYMVASRHPIQAADDGGFSVQSF